MCCRFKFTGSLMQGLPFLILPFWTATRLSTENKNMALKASASSSSSVFTARFFPHTFTVS